MWISGFIYDVSVSNISSILRGRSWSYLDRNKIKKDSDVEDSLMNTILLKGEKIRAICNGDVKDYVCK